MTPSSPPETMNGSCVFQLITLTSESWLSCVVNIQALDGAARTSHTRILLSTEQDANTYGHINMQAILKHVALSKIGQFIATIPQTVCATQSPHNNASVS